MLQAANSRGCGLLLPDSTATDMDAPVENPFIQNLSDSYGPMLAGAAMSCALWGISCMQL